MALIAPHVAGRDHHLADVAGGEVRGQANAKIERDVLVPLVGRGGHVEYSVDELIALAVVGQRVEHVDGPIGDQSGPGHKL